MMRAITRLDQRFFAPAPAERLAALRWIIGTFGTIYLAVRATHVLNVARLSGARFEPVGVVGLLDEPLSLGVVRVVLAISVVAGAAFTIGWRFRFFGPVFALGLLASLSYSNSWQHVAHTENLLVLHIGVLAISPAALAWSLDARRSAATRTAEPLQDSPAFGWPVRLMTLLTVVTYVLASVAKLRHGGLDWVDGDVLRNLIAHDNLRKIALGDVHSPIGGWIVRHGWLFLPIALASLTVELGAPIALLGGRARTVWIAAAWLFHVGVLAFMAILFIYPLTGVAFASMVRPEELVGRVARKVSNRRRPASNPELLATYGRRDV